jgi:hypothetical protein
MSAPVIVVMCTPDAPDLCGFIPSFLDADDPRPAREQLDSNYQHGGGWQPFEGFTMTKGGSIKYPGDPAHRPVAVIHLRDEKILIYRYAWVAIVQKDGTFEIARMD